MTKVTVEFFKYSGKHYTSFSFETETKAFDVIKIQIEAMSKSEFIKDMDYTIEVDEIGGGWNKVLFKNNS